MTQQRTFPENVSQATIYPHQSGDFIVIGPECFTDGQVIAYKGENYVRQTQSITPAEDTLKALMAQAFDEGKRACDMEWQQTADIVTADEYRFVAENPYRSKP